MRENKFQSKLIREIKDRFPGCIVMKNDCSYIQGIPDLLVLHGPHWAALEVKRNANASRRPNQDFYVKKMDDMSYASYVYPENKDDVIEDLTSIFR